MKIIFSSRNPSKIRQAKLVFAGSKISIVSLDEAGIEGEGVEDGVTLEQNAFKKAFYALERSQSWCIADDTGLFIDALNGRPGIHAVRWAGENATTDMITAHTLRQLNGVTNRSATFQTVVVAVSPDEDWYYFKAETKGRILESPRCANQLKMPYSSIFVPEGTNLVWAQMSLDEEIRISHRGVALRQAREFLKNKM